MELEERLLPIYDELMESTIGDLKFQGFLLDPTHTYESKLQLVSSRSNKKLERKELARLYYWLTQKYQRMQKSQRENIHAKFKSPEYKQYEQWEKTYDPARHSIYNARKLSEQEIAEKNINLPTDNQ